MTSESSNTRQTRSNSNPHMSFNLSDIKALVDNAKEEIVNSFSSKLNVINDSINCLIGKVDLLEERCSLLEGKFKEQESKCTKSFSLAADEAERRILRQKNIIISGLEVKTSGTLEERKEDDVGKCREVLSRLSVSAEDSIIQVTRIGNLAKTSRPLLKVTLDSFETKRMIIRKAKDLRSDFPHVYINPDRTPLQQLQQRELRQELKSRREKGEDVIIKGNSVVSRDTYSSQNFH